MAMKTKGGVAKKAAPMFGKKTKDSPAGPGAMPQPARRVVTALIAKIRGNSHG